MHLLTNEVYLKPNLKLLLLYTKFVLRLRINFLLWWKLFKFCVWKWTCIHCLVDEKTTIYLEVWIFSSVGTQNFNKKKNKKKQKKQETTKTSDESMSYFLIFKKYELKIPVFCLLLEQFNSIQPLACYLGVIWELPSKYFVLIFLEK